MLEVDIAGSTDRELQHIIRESCTPYGAVIKVIVHVNRVNSLSRPCAIVDMATAEQARQAADAFAATAIGKSVVIRVAAAAPNSHRPEAVPPSPEHRPKTMFQLLAQYEGQARHDYQPHR